MTLSRVSSNSAAALFLAILLGFPGCAGSTRLLREGTLPAAGSLRVAVLPMTNLSGVAAPLKDLRQSLIRGLTERGIPVLDEEALQSFMARHRVRYVAGIDGETGRSLQEETGADAVLITSLDLYSGASPPRVFLTSRLVSARSGQKILWMDGQGLAGDDSPGLLGLGLIQDPKLLLEKTVRALLDSLSARLSGREQGAGSPRKRFLPKAEFRSSIFNTDAKYRVAAMPFFDLSGKKNAGELMSLRFMSAMTWFNNFEVIEPGLVRDKLLKYRIIMDHGVSLPQADTLFDTLGADLVLTGAVFAYDDHQGVVGAPNVDFSVQLIERKSREIVWSSSSYNAGDDTVIFFDVGMINTAPALAARMVRPTVEKMIEK